MATPMMLTTFLMYAVVLTATRVAGTFDLSVVSVTRLLSEDRTQLTLTADFTSSEEPGVEFSYYYQSAVLEHVVEYSNGRGKASLTIPATQVTAIVLTIGKLNSHSLDIYIKFDEKDIHQLSMTQMLNTRPSTVSPGNDIAYSPGESFDVTVWVPWHPASQFSLSVPSDRDSNDVDTELISTYLDQATGEVVKSWDFPSVGNFLTVNKTYTYGEGAALQFSFSTTEEPVNGFFRIFVNSKFNESSTDEHFVGSMEETLLFSVHDNTKPGPFPTGFYSVKTETIPEECSADERTCMIHCIGYSNDLTSLAIYMVEEDGSETNITSNEMAEESGQYYKDVFALQKRSENVTGNYVCRIGSRDGATGETSTTLFSA